MLRQGTPCESASRRRGRGSRSPRSRCRARELSRSSEDGTRSPAGLRSGRQRAGLRGAACRGRRTGETRRSRRKRLFERSGITGFLPPARRLAEAQAAIRGPSRPPGGDPHSRAALSGAGGTGGRALGEPRFEHSGELPDSATVGVLGERAALSLGRDAAPLFFVREEMPNLVH